MLHTLTVADVIVGIVVFLIVALILVVILAIAVLAQIIHIVKMEFQDVRIEYDYFIGRNVRKG